MDVATIFQVVKVGQSIAELLGIIESVNVKVDRLANSELDAALTALSQAQISESETTSLLREARARLNKAIHLENGNRLLVAYLGLAFCHYHLGDKNNSHKVLQQITTTDFGSSRENVLMGSIILGAVSAPILGGTLTALSSKKIKEIVQREELKKEIQRYLQSTDAA